MAVISNGTTLIDNGILDAAVPTGSLTLLSTQTASASATISFTSGIDSTYDSYVFKFINIHPQTTEKDFSFQVDTGTNTNYNQTITSTMFRALHAEADDDASLGYTTAYDQAQGTSFQVLSGDVKADSDSSVSGSLTLFNPSSSTFVKHFISTTNAMWYEPYSIQTFVAGYINTTTALTRIQFKMDSGNIDSGIIKLYGIGG
jgi:hypothetical protein